MKKAFFTLYFLQFVIVSVFAQISVSTLLTNNLINPIGIDKIPPRFSWQLKSEKRNILQSAYEIKVTAGRKSVWNSGKINSESSVFIPYAGKVLKIIKEK